VQIVFMGTPEFAVPVLDALAARYEIRAVYTRPDQPAGRGQKLAEAPVKILARERQLTIEQPRTLRAEEPLARLRGFAPDLIVVAAYGLILPQAVLDLPRLGALNVHASLLPRHRGAAPIPAAILAGDAETGITLMKMDAGQDTGPIIVQRVLPIASDDTTGTLTTKLARLGADLLVETLPDYVAGKIALTLQDDAQATLTRRIKKEAGLIDWHAPAEQIARQVRAYNPKPSAHTFWNGAQLKIWRAESAPIAPEVEPGQVVKTREGLAVACGAGALILREVQLAGKRTMSIEEFARGQRGFLGAILGS
jgi:methionyl-tRNA formyltransferase